MTALKDDRIAALPYTNLDNQRHCQVPSSLCIPRPSFTSNSQSEHASITGFCTLHLGRQRTLRLYVLFLCLVSLPAVYIYGQKSGLTSSIKGLGHAVVPKVSDETSLPRDPRPLTDLGLEADEVYKNIGSIDMNDYRQDLVQFLTAHFPLPDLQASDPDSLLSILHTFLQVSPSAVHVNVRPGLLPMLWDWIIRLPSYLWQKPISRAPSASQKNIPRNIFQTGRTVGTQPPPGPSDSWRRLNPNYDYQYFDDTAASAYFESRFNASLLNRTTNRSITQTYRDMADVPVMQSDFWRYAILATEGGVYSDIDTICLKPVEQWHERPWLRMLNLSNAESGPKPAMIIGIEQDVGTLRNWHSFWPRPLGMVQWTMASTRGHPILIDTMRRVSEAVERISVSTITGHGQTGAARDLWSVIETSGPAAFTDATLRYLGALYNVTWPDLRYLSDEGILFGHEGMPADVLLLSMTAFSPGHPKLKSGSTRDRAALVQHLFAGSWKHG